MLFLLVISRPLLAGHMLGNTILHCIGNVLSHVSLGNCTQGFSIGFIKSSCPLGSDRHLYPMYKDALPVLVIPTKDQRKGEKQPGVFHEGHK